MLALALNLVFFSAKSLSDIEGLPTLLYGLRKALWPRVATGEACGPPSGVLRELRAGGGSGQRREERHAQFPLNCCFSWPSPNTAKGVCAELGLGPGRGQSQGGLLPFQKEEAHGHFRHWQAWVLGCLCCTGFAGKAFRLLGDPGCAGRPKLQGVSVQPSHAPCV